MVMPLSRDPAGIRNFLLVSDEVVVVASERPVIQTVFNTSFNDTKEVKPGDCLVIKKNGKFKLKTLLNLLRKNPAHLKI